MRDQMLVTLWFRRGCTWYSFRPTIIIHAVVQLVNGVYAALSIKLQLQRAMSHTMQPNWPSVAALALFPAPPSSMPGALVDGDMSQAS